MKFPHFSVGMPSSADWGKMREIPVTIKQFFDYHLGYRIDIAFIWDNPKLSIQYTGEIIDEKMVCPIKISATLNCLHELLYIIITTIQHWLQKVFLLDNILYFSFQYQGPLGYLFQSKVYW